MQRSLLYVHACDVKHNVSLVGRHGQLEEPGLNSRFSCCVLGLARSFLAYTSLCSGSQSLGPEISAFHMLCKQRRAKSASSVDRIII